MMTLPLRRLWNLLCSERGDADPVLTIVSMFLSAMITVVVLGTLVMIIQFGSNFVTDQVRSTSLATAQKAWSQDAANASEVKVRDAQQATFYEEPGYRPGVYTPRGDDKANQCRKSVWTLSGGVLSNVVSKFSQATCDLVTTAGVETVDPTIIPLSTTETLTVTGMSSVTSIVATNAAGRDLHYVNGVEIGLAVGSSDPSTNTRDSWWRDYEWAFTQPAAINFVGKIELPTSGLRPSALRGDTSISPISQGPTLSTLEVPPVQTVYDPGVVTILSVTRSSTTGDIFPKPNGSREGINVQFSGVSCGPYSTQYGINWTTATVGATPTRTASETTFGAPLPIDFDKVPNGAVGTVTVTASCPTSTKPFTTPPYSYTQPVPTPTLTATAGTPPNVHTLTWAPVTSLAAQYTTTLSRYSGAFAVDTAVSTNPTTAAAETVTYPLGSTYGVPMAYQITAAVGPTRSNPSAPQTVLTDWPPVIAPALTKTPVGLLLTVTSDPALCPAGTHPEYSQVWNLNGLSPASLPVWSTNPVVQNVLHEGDQVVIAGTARCAYTGNMPSPASTPPAGLTYIQPITTVPNPPKITTWGDNPIDSNPVNPTYTVPATSCPAGTTVEYHTQYFVTGPPDVPLTTWTPWSTATTTSINMVRQGNLLTLTVAARCVSPYTNGPPSVTTQPWPRPIPAPAAPIAGHDAGGASTIKDDRFTYTAVICPAGSTATYLRDWFVAGVGSGNDPTWTKTLDLNVGTNWGFDYYYTVHARCESQFIVSGPSPAASTSWQTPIPAPGGTPALNLSTGSTRVNANFNVYLSGAFCQPGLQLLWNVTPTGGQVTGSFTTHLTTTGWHTYNSDVFCHSAYSGRNGPAVGAPARSIDITPPPAPNWSGSSPSGMFTSCYANTVQVDGFWTSVSNATSYSASSYITVLGVVYSAPASVSYSGGQWISSSNFSGPSAFQVTASHIIATARGAGGSTSQWITASYSTC